jgi:hypothetical protein
MDRCGGAATRLPESGRKDLAIQVLAGTETVSDLAAQHGVSRKFVYAQTGKARAALDDAFLATAPENDVLFNLAVTKTWVHQVIVALPLICHSSYRGVIEFIRHLLGVSVSVGAVHDALQSAARQAGFIKTPRTCQVFAWACTTRYSRVQCQFWPASMPRRRTAIFWSRNNIATRIPGVCICSTPAHAG